MSLPPGFLDRPFAHRALHGPARPENSIPAIRAAIAASWGIEIDVQPSADGIAMVFHDATLDRLTGSSGPVRERTAAELGQIRLGDAETAPPSLAAALDEIGGRVPVLVELKDQSDTMGATDGTLERAVARPLAGYSGPVAVMSFNPEVIARMRDLAPDLPRGLTTAAFGAEWDLPRAVRDRLRAIPDFDRVGATFVSHEAADLGRARVLELKRRGAAILCWTIRSQEAADAARRVAHQITFEHFVPT